MFYVHAGPRKAYDRTYAMDICSRCAGDGYKACDECPEPGWYWWACFPGCLPDSDPMGPFATEAEALADAQSNNE